MHIEIIDESNDQLIRVTYVFDIDSDMEVRLIKMFENQRKTKRHKYTIHNSWYGFKRSEKTPLVSADIMSKVESEIIKRIHWRTNG